MSEKTTTEQPKTREQLTAERNKYLQAREKFPEKWTDSFQKQLEAIEAELASLEVPVTTYKVPKGTADMLHVKLVKGRRFNPNTGKEEAVPYVQMFSKSEYRVFEPAANRLGYTILEILHKPA